MSHRYLYLKLLLRNLLQLEADECALLDTAQQGLVCSFMGMKLSSTFQPVLRSDGKPVGREALLCADSLSQGRLAPEAAFDEAIGSNRLVQFDRLVRVIHLLNHARAPAEHELLFLKVHPHLLASVSGHGRTFERILHYYSVPTSQVVIALRETADTHDEVLADAAENYRSLGYRIAVDNFGAAHSSLQRVLELKPDVVKLDGALIRSTEHSRCAATAFQGLVEHLRSAGIQVLAGGIESARQLEVARRSGAELLQGHHLAFPEHASAARGRLAA